MIRRTLCLATLFVASVLALSSEATAQDVNCGDFPNQKAAQDRLKQDSSDPDGLDGPSGPGSSGIPGVARDLYVPICVLPSLGFASEGVEAVQAGNVEASPLGLFDQAVLNSRKPPELEGFEVYSGLVVEEVRPHPAGSLNVPLLPNDVPHHAVG